MRMPQPTLSFWIGLAFLYWLCSMLWRHFIKGESFIHEDYDMGKKKAPKPRPNDDGGPGPGKH